MVKKFDNVFSVFWRKNRISLLLEVSEGTAKNLEILYSFQNVTLSENCLCVQLDFFYSMRLCVLRLLYCIHFHPLCDTNFY